MGMFDNLFKKKDEDPRKLNPIVQKSPAPVQPVRASNAKPVPKSAPAPAPAPKAVAAAPSPPPEPPKAERETKKRKKSEGSTKVRNSETKSRPSDDAAFVKRGLVRQSKGDHDGAIEDFTKAISLNENCVQAYASRGVSREAKGDGAGAKADYSKSIQIEIMGEITRQMRDNPDVEM